MNFAFVFLLTQASRFILLCGAITMLCAIYFLEKKPRDKDEKIYARVIGLCGFAIILSAYYLCWQYTGKLI